jgi:hypothetical protein
LVLFLETWLSAKRVGIKTRINAHVELESSSRAEAAEYWTAKPSVDMLSVLGCARTVPVLVALVFMVTIAAFAKEASVP